MGKRHGDSLGESEAEVFEAPLPPPKSASLQQPPPPSHALWPQMQMQMRSLSPMPTHSASPPALLPALGRGLQADVGGGVGGPAGRAGAELPPLTPAARLPADAPPPPPMFASFYNALSQEAGRACRGVEACGGRPSHATYDRGFEVAIEALLSSELELRAQERAAASGGPPPPLTPIRGLSSASRSASASASGSLSYCALPPPPCGCAGCETLVRQPHTLPTPPPRSVSGDGCESHYSSTCTGSACGVQWFAHRTDSCNAAVDVKPKMSCLQQSDPLAGAPVHSPPRSQHSLDDDPHASHQSLLNNLLTDGAASAAPAKSDEDEDEATAVAARASRLPPKLRWRAANRSLQMQMQPQEEKEQKNGEMVPVRPSGGTRAAAAPGAPGASDARALCAALDPRLLERTCGAHVRHELRVEREIAASASASASAAGSELLHAETALFCAHRVRISSVSFVVTN